MSDRVVGWKRARGAGQLEVWHVLPSKPISSAVPKLVVLGAYTACSSESMIGHALPLNVVLKSTHQVNGLCCRLFLGSTFSYMKDVYLG